MGHLRRLTFLLPFLVMSLVAQEDDYRTLTDKRGRTIVAKIVRVAGSKVQIERKDGRRFVVEMNNFSEADQDVMMKFAMGDTMGDKPAGARRGIPKPLAVPGPKPAAPNPERPVDEGDVFAFKEVRFKEKKTDHFTIYSSEKEWEPAHPYAEKTWDLIDGIFPITFRADYERQKFAAPDKGPNRSDFGQSDGAFRYRIYFAQSDEEYGIMSGQYAATLPEDQQARFAATAPRTGNFEDDLGNRWMVIKKDPIDPRSYNNLLVHGLAGQLTSGHAQMRGLPLWLSAGIGYWAENKLFKSCAVLYLDFEQYYGEKGNITEGDILDSTSAWAKPIRNLCRKGTRYTVADVVHAEVSSLTPELSGYTFALVSFLVEEDARRRKFHKMLYDQREGAQEITPEMLVESIGYPSAEAFEKEWYAYIMSNAFK